MTKIDMKTLVAKYGSLAMGTHILLSLSFLGMTYLLVERGFDLESRLKRWGLLKESGDENKGKLGNFACAYIIYKSTMPIRLPITIAVVTFIAKKMKR